MENPESRYTQLEASGLEFHPRRINTVGFGSMSPARLLGSVFLFQPAMYSVPPVHGPFRAGVIEDILRASWVGD